jgi:hypothetical protein
MRAVSIFLENGGKKFQFFIKGILVTESFGCVNQGSQVLLFDSKKVM